MPAARKPGAGRPGPTRTTTAIATPGPATIELARPLRTAGPDSAGRRSGDPHRLVAGDLLEPLLEGRPPLVARDQGDHVVAHRHPRATRPAAQLVVEVVRDVLHLDNAHSIILTFRDHPQPALVDAGAPNRPERSRLAERSASSPGGRPARARRPASHPSGRLTMRDPDPAGAEVADGQRSQRAVGRQVGPQHRPPEGPGPGTRAGAAGGRAGHEGGRAAGRTERRSRLRPPQAPPGRAEGADGRSGPWRRPAPAPDNSFSIPRAGAEARIVGLHGPPSPSSISNAASSPGPPACAATTVTAAASSEPAASPSQVETISWLLILAAA